MTIYIIKFDHALHRNNVVNKLNTVILCAFKRKKRNKITKNSLASLFKEAVDPNAINAKMNTREMTPFIALLLLYKNIKNGKHSLYREDVIPFT